MHARTLQGRWTTRGLEENLKRTLNDKEVAVVMNSQHKVVKTLSMISEIAYQVGACSGGCAVAH